MATTLSFWRLTAGPGEVHSCGSSFVHELGVLHERQ